MHSRPAKLGYKYSRSGGLIGLSISSCTEQVFSAQLPPDNWDSDLDSVSVVFMWVTKPETKTAKQT